MTNTHVRAVVDVSQEVHWFGPIADVTGRCRFGRRRRPERRLLGGPAVEWPRHADDRRRGRRRSRPQPGSAGRVQDPLSDLPYLPTLLSGGAEPGSRTIEGHVRRHRRLRVHAAVRAARPQWPDRRRSTGRDHRSLLHRSHRGARAVRRRCPGLRRRRSVGRLSRRRPRVACRREQHRHPAGVAADGPDRDPARSGPADDVGRGGNRCGRRGGRRRAAAAPLRHRPDRVPSHRTRSRAGARGGLRRPGDGRRPPRR